MSDYLKELSSEFNENLKLNYDLKKKNWFNIGGKTKIYFKAKNLINIKSNTIDKGKPRNIEIIFINAKYLYSMSIIRFSKPLLYLRKRENK